LVEHLIEAQSVGSSILP